MKKTTFFLFLLLAANTSYADDRLWKEAGQSCVFGGSVLGVTSIVVLYPAIAMGTNSIPVASLILGNTLFGCGIAAIGASAAYAFGWAYDRAFGPEPSELPQNATTVPAPSHPAPPAAIAPPAPPPAAIANPGVPPGSAH